MEFLLLGLFVFVIVFGGQIAWQRLASRPSPALPYDRIGVLPPAAPSTSVPDRQLREASLLLQQLANDPNWVLTADKQVKARSWLEVYTHGSSEPGILLGKAATLLHEIEAQAPYLPMASSDNLRQATRWLDDYLQRTV